ncbi:hypothetical protein O0I10_007404 [Lichtheimia ornata]|uniref:Transmembrane protein 198 n=1 Tax=Lichtheimia ornata TaxID=688661 RepID=A0AAD7V2A0_9FUNG|nr:uncharacterized protein O0I10_007404 [Lichtheimia ornata]KAJ8656807.1 hypothetical protein O0I10_007404 [Lichtheimia ornata]
MESEVATYGSVNITAEMGVAAAALMACAMFLLVLGYHMQRITSGVIGFLAIGLFTWIALANQRPSGGYNSNDAITMLVVPAGLGALGGLVCFFIQAIRVYVIGAIGGLVLALYILSWREDLVITQPVGRACFIALLPLLTTAITWTLDQYAVLFFVSMTGAYTFIVGIDFLAHTGYISGVKQILDHNDVSQYNIDARVYVMLVITAVACILSLIWQHLYAKQKSTIHAATKDEEAPPAESPLPEQEPNTATAGETHGSGAPSSAALSPRSMSVS